MRVSSLRRWWNGAKDERPGAPAEASAFRRRLEGELARASRLGQPMAVIALEDSDRSARG